jgi:PleD family two-component response regulator
MKEPLLGGEPADLQQKKRVSGSIKILLVEDHADTVKALVRLLEHQAHKVRAEGTVASALDAVHEETFDLLICDIGLPDGTGFELMQEVLKICNTPELALTGLEWKKISPDPGEPDSRPIFPSR